MGRNLVICCDGTNNEFGERNTNVARLVQVLDRDATRQLVYYDPGVGTLAEPGMMTRVGKKMSQLWGLAFGTGLMRNVEEAYVFLMENWEPGDRVYLFGFSRGAYTVRVLAGVLHLLGLLPRGNHNLVPYMLRLFGSIKGGSTRDEGRNERRFRLCNGFRETFARTAPDFPKEKNFPVHFVGVWDTVSSVGWVWNQATFPFTRTNPSVTFVRHAVAIDERRAFYRQNLFNPGAGQDWQETWFAGVHSDVGGGYATADRKNLWRPPFEWVMEQAREKGLFFSDQEVAEVLAVTAGDPAIDRAHESLTWYWWPCELFPKLAFRGRGKWRLPRLGLGRRRTLPAGSTVAGSVLRRIRDRNAGYGPSNLSGDFLARVRALDAASLPASMAISGAQPPRVTSAGLETGARSPVDATGPRLSAG